MNLTKDQSDMRTAFLTVLLYVVCGPLSAAGFDALNAAPTATPVANAAIAANISARFRDTYTTLLSWYQDNDRELSRPGTKEALTPAQWTEAVTVQWQIYNILKSINPAADIPSPGASPTPSPSPSSTVKLAPVSASPSPKAKATATPKATPKKK